MKLNSIVLWVNSLENTVRFYRDVLGLKELFRDEIACALLMGGTLLVLHRSDAVHDLPGSSLRGRPWPGGSPDDFVGRHSLRFDVEDPDTWAEKLSRVGIPIDDGPVDSFWGRFIVVRDPEGRSICLAKFAFPIPNE
jgi:catechol 2,3-dioxygenase-like lactoylglutathione lyase family enzyme